VNPTLLTLVASPWILWVLIQVLERKTPMKFWAAPLLLSLMAPALAIGHNWFVLQSWWRMEGSPPLLWTLLINIVLIGSFTFYLREMCPRRCPECENRTMIPLRNFWGPEARTRNTRWCASCGALYWKATGGEWKKERRRTWLDIPWKEAAGCRNDQPPFDTDARVIAPIITQTRTRIIATEAETRIAASTADPGETLLLFEGNPGPTGATSLG
jgi:hypothetical protein